MPNDFIILILGAMAFGGAILPFFGIVQCFESDDWDFDIVYSFIIMPPACYIPPYIIYTFYFPSVPFIFVVYVSCFFISRFILSLFYTKD